ncbi:MAG: hypothetical protein IJH88_01590 [Eggerthellaceae bacterium]|nr:hypothetical protein [Eggerthellaceae bacterium]
MEKHNEASTTQRKIELVALRNWQRQHGRLMALLGCMVVMAVAMALMIPAAAVTKDSADEVGIVMDGESKASDEAPGGESAGGSEETADAAESSAPENADSESVSANENATTGDSANNVESGTDSGDTSNDAEANDAKSNSDGSSGSDDGGLSGALADDGSSSDADTDGQGSESDDAAAAGELIVDASASAVGSVDSNSEDAEMPAQSFEANLEDSNGNVVLTVAVKAPEGALHAGTTMKVKRVGSSAIQDAVEDAVAKRIDGKVAQIQAVDITFVDTDGNEVEPTADVTVKFSSALIADNEAPLIVHVDDEGEANLVGTLTDRELKRRDLSKEDDELYFEAGEFSTYGIVIATLAQTLTASDGKTYTVTATCPADAGIPQDAELSVEEISDESGSYKDYVSKTENALGMDEGSAGFVRLFDIKIVDKDDPSVKYQPKESSTVDVRIELDNVENGQELRVVHFEDENEDGDTVDAKTDGQAVSFGADGFSVYAITGGTIAVDYLTAGGKTLTVTVKFDDNETIPKGAELHVNEILEGDEGWFSRSTQLADVLYKNYGNVTISDVRHLGVQFLADGEEFTPKYPVQLTIQYADALSTEDTIDYGTDLDGEQIVPKDKANRFVTVKYTAKGAELIDSVNTFNVEGIDKTICNVDGSADLDLVYVYEYDTLKAVPKTHPSLEMNGPGPVFQSRALGAKVLGEILREGDQGPDHSKDLYDKGDGTYTIGLNVKGEADVISETKSNANVVIIYDTSTSMIAPGGFFSTDPERNNYIPMATGGRGIDTSSGNVTTYSDGIYFELYRQNDSGDGYTLIGNDNYPTPVYRKTTQNVNTRWYSTSRNGNYQTRYTGTFYTRSPRRPYTYSPTSYNGNNLPPSNDSTTYYTEDGNQLYSRTGTVQTEVYTEYTGARYSYSIDRADASEKVVYDFTHALFRYQNPDDPSTSENESENIQAAFITFDGTANTRVEWTSAENSITSLVDNTGTNHKLPYANYTNWTAALEAAETLVYGADPDPTYVVFITDGRPQTTDESQAEPNYDASKDIAKRIQERCDQTGGAFYGVFAFANSDDWLAALMYYAYQGRDPSNPGTSFDTEGYFKASDSEALTQAINQIFQRIVDTVGIGKVSIADGTTSNVQTTSGEVADLLDVDTGSFKYWLSWNVNNNSDGTYSFHMKDKATGDDIPYTVNYSNGTAIISWMDGTTPKTATYPAEILAGNVLRLQWNRVTDFYGFGPPAAVFDDPVVNWNLNSVGTLLDGVTYTMTFDCYPSQETLDYIADLKNNKISYEDLDANIREYLVKNGSEYELKTNTTASLTYTDTRQENPQPVTTTYSNPDPVGTSAVQALAISKKWENALDGRTAEPIELEVTRDGADRYKVALDQDHGWTASAFVSIGIMTIHDEVVSVKTPGHDFSFAEPENLAYYWEIDAPTVHPMKINGADTILVEVTGENIPSAMTGLESPAEYRDGNKTYYKMHYNGADKYYIVDSTAASLTATNSRRSSLNVTKAVEGNNAPPDALFDFTIKVDDKNDEDVWFSIWDENNNYVINTSEITYISGEGVQAEYKDGVPTGFYHAPNETQISFKLKNGWNLRFANLPTGTTYEVVESGTMPDECFEFVSVEGGREYYVYSEGSEEPVEQHEQTGNPDQEDRKITGTIGKTNSIYTMIYTNKFNAAAVTVAKEADVSDGTTFEIIATVMEGDAPAASLPTQTDSKVTLVEDHPNQLKISLKSGETATLNLREGQKLKIEETSNAGYTTSYSYKLTEDGAVQTGDTIESITDGNAMTVTNTCKKTDIRLKKVAKGSTSPLPGSEFKLYRKNSEGSYVADESIDATKPETILQLTDGALLIEGLPVGDYKLTETKEPSGYIVLSKDIYFTVNADGTGDVITTTTGQEPYSSQDIGAYTEGTNNNTLVVPNTPGVALPSTGGPGTSLVYLFGAILVVLGVAGLAIRLRHKSLDMNKA